MFDTFHSCYQKSWWGKKRNGGWMPRGSLKGRKHNSAMPQAWVAYRGSQAGTAGGGKSPKGGPGTAGYAAGGCRPLPAGRMGSLGLPCQPNPQELEWPASTRGPGDSSRARVGMAVSRAGPWQVLEQKGPAFCPIRTKLHSKKKCPKIGNNWLWHGWVHLKQQFAVRFPGAWFFVGVCSCA